MGQYPYDLLERTKAFARNVRQFIRQVPKDIGTMEDCKQLTRSSGSVGANYIEANEAFSKNDFRFRIKICRKESKESAYWLDLLGILSSPLLEATRKQLEDESRQLVKIFNAILQNSQQNRNN
jgi:four helix bundle protein